MVSRPPDIANPRRQSYPSDLSNMEWNMLQPLLPKPKGFGHPINVDFCEILNGILSILRSGCQGEMGLGLLETHYFLLNNS